MTQGNATGNSKNTTADYYKSGDFDGVMSFLFKNHPWIFYQKYRI